MMDGPARRPARRLVVEVQAAAPHLHERIAGPAELAIEGHHAPELLAPPRNGRVDIRREQMHMMQVRGRRRVLPGGAAVRHAGAGALTSSTVLPSGSWT